MAKKFLTNEDVLKRLLKELSGIETAILRERMLTIFTHYLSDEAKIIETWGNPMVSGQSYVNVLRKVVDLIKFVD